MKRVRSWLVWTIAVATVLAWNSAAMAQTTPGAPGVPTLGQHASDNVSPGAIAARAPGNMVGAGVGRAQAAADFARGGIEITETSRPTSPRAVFLSKAIKIIFDQLNSALLLFENLLRLRAGQPPLDTAAPTVSSTSPADGATGVAINTKITATFSEAMDSSTITAATRFTMTGPGTTPVSGTVAYDVPSNIATFTPTSNLAPDTEFTVTITTGVEDLAGIALASDFVWTFTTAPGAPVPDTTAPTVSATTPAAGATGVAINTKITAAFGEAMDSTTITAANLTVAGPGATSVTGTVAYDAANNIATFTPDNDLMLNTVYTATITTGVEDLASNALASDFVWTFTTGITQDTTAPLVNSTSPANAAAGVVINTRITAIFGEAMAPSTITATTFTVAGPGTTPVSGDVTYAAVGNTATFTPAGNLTPNTSYTATITTAVRDLAGNALAVNKVWTFATAAASP